MSLFLPAPTNNSSYIGRVISFYFVLYFVLLNKLQVMHIPLRSAPTYTLILTVTFVI